MSLVSSAPPTPVAPSRPNIKIAQIVHTGLLLKKTDGSARAAAFLYQRGVPISVIVRVLKEPARRRQESPGQTSDVPV